MTTNPLKARGPMVQAEEFLHSASDFYHRIWLELA
jgi:hypothetical protein